MNLPDSIQYKNMDMPHGYRYYDWTQATPGALVIPTVKGISYILQNDLSITMTSKAKIFVPRTQIHTDIINVNKSNIEQKYQQAQNNLYHKRNTILNKLKKPQGEGACILHNYMCQSAENGVLFTIEISALWTYKIIKMPSAIRIINDGEFVYV